MRVLLRSGKPLFPDLTHSRIPAGTSVPGASHRRVASIASRFVFDRQSRYGTITSKSAEHGVAVEHSRRVCHTLSQR